MNDLPNPGPGAMNVLITQMHDLVHAMSEDEPDGIGISRVVQFAAAAMPGVEHAGISLIHSEQPPETIAATGQLPLRVDEIQYDEGEGPCLQALVKSDMVWSGDLSKDQQWPRFAARAVKETGVHSMASFRLFLSEKSRGALNLYSARPQAFDELALGVGALFASYASLTLLNDHHRDKAMHLERALESSREIGTAIGILMARDLCTSDQAFDMLSLASQHTNRKLRDIARDVKETGTLPNLDRKH